MYRRRSGAETTRARTQRLGNTLASNPPLKSAASPHYFPLSKETQMQAVGCHATLKGTMARARTRRKGPSIKINNEKVHFPFLPARNDYSVISPEAY